MFYILCTQVDDGTSECTIHIEGTILLNLLSKLPYKHTISHNTTSQVPESIIYHRKIPIWNEWFIKEIEYNVYIHNKIELNSYTRDRYRKKNITSQLKTINRNSSSDGDYISDDSSTIQQPVHDNTSSSRSSTNNTRTHTTNSNIHNTATTNDTTTSNTTIYAEELLIEYIETRNLHQVPIDFTIKCIHSRNPKNEPKPENLNTKNNTVTKPDNNNTNIPTNTSNIINIKCQENNINTPWLIKYITYNIYCKSLPIRITCEVLYIHILYKERDLNIEIMNMINDM